LLVAEAVVNAVFTRGCIVGILALEKIVRENFWADGAYLMVGFVGFLMLD